MGQHYTGLQKLVGINQYDDPLKERTGERLNQIDDFIAQQFNPYFYKERYLKQQKFDSQYIQTFQDMGYKKKYEIDDEQVHDIQVNQFNFVSLQIKFKKVFSMPIYIFILKEQEEQKMEFFVGMEENPSWSNFELFYNQFDEKKGIFVNFKTKQKDIFCSFFAQTKVNFSIKVKYNEMYYGKETQKSIITVKRAEKPQTQIIPLNQFQKSDKLGHILNSGNFESFNYQIMQKNDARRDSQFDIKKPLKLIKGNIMSEMLSQIKQYIQQKQIEEQRENSKYILRNIEEVQQQQIEQNRKEKLIRKETEEAKGHRAIFFNKFQSDCKARKNYLDMSKKNEQYIYKYISLFLN